MALGLALSIASAPSQAARGLNAFDNFLANSSGAQLVDSAGNNLRSAPYGVKYATDSVGNILTNSSGQAIVMPS